MLVIFNFFDINFYAIFLDIIHQFSYSFICFYDWYQSGKKSHFRENTIFKLIEQDYAKIIAIISYFL